jgi:uncharacterized membrane protein required for colicin V production
MLDIWRKIDFKLRICILVLITGLLVFPIGIICYGISEVLGFYFGVLGGVTTIVGFVSLIIYWASWADS